MTTTTPTTVYLLNPEDSQDVISQFHFTSKEAAHEYMIAEFPNDHYQFAEEFDRIWHDEN